MRALVLTLLAALPLSGVAAPFALRLGETRVVLDAPAGFADTLDLASPRLQALAEAHTSASNRILLFALTDGDLRTFSAGDAPQLRRYLLVATPRALERDSVSLNQFRGFAADAARPLGEPADPADVLAFLDTQPVGRTVLLRELQRSTVLVSLLAGARLPPQAERPTEHLLFTTTLMLVRGKALSVSAYARMRSPSDQDWLLDVTRRWTEELQRLNGR